MVYSVSTHWTLGETLQTQENVCFQSAECRAVEHA